jgi:hypothetical protein
LSGDANPTKVIAAMKLDDVIKNSEYVRTESPDSGKSHYVRKVHTYKTPISIKGKNKTVGLIILEGKDGNRYYDHFEALGNG